MEQCISKTHIIKSIKSVSNQCSKLRVHPAPGVHILAAGCMDFFNPLHPMCACVFKIKNIPLYRNVLHIKS